METKKLLDLLEGYSTSEILYTAAEALKRRARLIALPPGSVARRIQKISEHLEKEADDFIKFATKLR